MNLRFHEEDWERIERDWTAFWNEELKRPMVWLNCYEPSSQRSVKKRHFLPQYAQEMSAGEIIAIESTDLERRYFSGDSFPKFWLNFGPGSCATYFGSEVSVSEETVWFEPIGKEIRDIGITVNKKSYWYQRIHSIMERALHTWKGAVQVGFSDIGGNLDIIASLRGTSEVLFDLYDHPDSVDKLVKDMTSTWIDVFQEEAQKIQAVCRGTSCWGPVWSKGTTYFLQSDFCYMISPKMFERFVLPDVETLCEHIDDPFFHLDGKGELPHLDMLLSIDKLKGVQWQPGDGQPLADAWPEVLKKIRDAGKLCQIYVTPEGAKRVKNEFGGTGFIFEIVDQGFSPDEASDLFKELTM